MCHSLCLSMLAEVDQKSCSGLDSGARTRQLTEHCDEILLPLPAPNPTPAQDGCPEDKSGTQLSVLCRSAKVLEEVLKHSLLSQARYPHLSELLSQGCDDEGFERIL